MWKPVDFMISVEINHIYIYISICHDFPAQRITPVGLITGVPFLLVHWVSSSRRKSTGNHGKIMGKSWEHDRKHLGHSHDTPRSI